MRVLIADPDGFLRSTYGECLRRRGFLVATAADGLECLARLRDFAPDILLLEPAMPWGGGDGVAALMREEPALRPAGVIVLTHGRDRSVLYWLGPLKIDDFQTKPLTAEQIAARIDRIVHDLIDKALCSKD
jgi:CheY-like chemotaxis protein